MSIFRPFRKDPKKFNYIPRYYDAQKEAREQRRRELYDTVVIDELYFLATNGGAGSFTAPAPRAMRRRATRRAAIYARNAKHAT